MNKRIKLNDEESNQQQPEQQQLTNDLFSIVIGATPIVDRLVEFGINPATLRRVTSKLFRESYRLKQLEQLITDSEYSDEEWADAIAYSMTDDKSDWFGLKRDFSDEFPLSGGGYVNKPCVTLIPVHDSELPFKLICHVNVIEPADRIQTRHVDVDYGAEDLDPMCGCPCCQISDFDQYLNETHRCEFEEHHFIKFDLQKALQFKDTQFADKFTSNICKPFSPHYCEWINNRYMQTFRFEAIITCCCYNDDVSADDDENDDKALQPKKEDIKLLLLHLFKTFGAPRATTVHTIATECFMLAMRFARRPMISTVLLCTAIRSLISKRIPSVGGISYVQRIVTRTALVALACINRHPIDGDTDDDYLQIDDEKILAMQENHFNIKLQHTRHHTENHLRAICDLLCRVALHWCFENKK